MMVEGTQTGAVVKLGHPIRFGSELITEMTVQRIKAKHLRGIDQETTNGQLELLSRITGQPPAVIDDLDAVDLKELDQVVQGFLSTSAAGKTP